MRVRRTLCVALLVALALAQTLGLLHRIVHARLGVHAALAASAGEVVQPSSKTGDALKALFAGHSNEQGCDLYDQFTYADGVATAPPAAVLLHTAETGAHSFVALALAVQAAGFLARGPPAAV